MLSSCFKLSSNVNTLQPADFEPVGSAKTGEGSRGSRARTALCPGETLKFFYFLFFRGMIFVFAAGFSRM